MAKDEDNQATFGQDDHKVAYIFNPDEGASGKGRPAKKRRVSRKPGKPKEESQGGLFVPLLNGAEKAECVALRQTLFEETWSTVNERVQNILKESNSAILEQVTAFASDSHSRSIDKIPSAFIITGPDIASQDLLFDQLAENLEAKTTGKVVRLRSAEVGSLKAALKRIIQGVTTKQVSGDDEEDEEDGAVAAEKGINGRRYLDYDLEALYAFLKTQSYDHVYVSFQDSEGFDSGLLSELITLLRSWRPRIPFTLLFGIATSVELLQSRLLKSACRHIYGAQFDGVQRESTLETIFTAAIASSDLPVRMGPAVLKWMLDRQRDQVAGIQLFVSSLKYAYMCHFYANPLSILCSERGSRPDSLQPEHLEAIRNMPSFRTHVEASTAEGTADSLQHAKSLIESDDYLKHEIQTHTERRRAWTNERLRSLLILEAAGLKMGGFARAYVDMMHHGIQMGDSSHFVESVRRMSVDKLQSMLRRVIQLLSEGDASLSLGGLKTGQGQRVRIGLEEQLSQLTDLRARADEAGLTVRSKYMGHGKVMRTTVIAQKVQLSQDSATLNEEDKQLTSIIDAVTGLIAASRHDETVGKDVVFSEGWLYDSRNPSRDIFVPRPRLVFQRSLSRPHDYLGCKCCAPGANGAPAAGGSLPATAILYQLYQETGNLINVADLWSAFHATVSGGKNAEEEDEEADRKALVMFYRGLAELRSLGYVRPSKKKTDHIAKVKWL